MQFYDFERAGENFRVLSTIFSKVLLESSNSFTPLSLTQYPGPHFCFLRRFIDFLLPQPGHTLTNLPICFQRFRESIGKFKKYITLDLSAKEGDAVWIYLIPRQSSPYAPPL